MESERKKQIAIGVVAVGLGALALAFWMTRSGGNNPNAPGGTFWMCSNNQCKHEFNLTVAEVAEHHEKHYGDPIPCPKCKSPSAGALQCPHCKKLYPKGRGIANCPHCGKSLTSGDGG